MQDLVNWIVAIEILLVEFLTVKLHIPFYFIKLTATFLLVLWICLIIWAFSRQLSKKNLFTLDPGRFKGENPSRWVKMGSVALYIIKYLVLFPIYTLVWGILFVVFLVLLVSEDNYRNVVFFSTITIAVIRAIAYFNEQYANELAKALPIVLLVTVMLDPEVLTKVTLSINFSELLQGDAVILSFGFIVAEEWFLRAIHEVRSAYRKKKEAGS